MFIATTRDAEGQCRLHMTTDAWISTAETSREAMTSEASLKLTLALPYMFLGSLPAPNTLNILSILPRVGGVDLHADSPHWISPGNRAWTDSAHISVCNLLPRHPSTPRTNLAFVMEGQPHRTSGACNCSHSSCQQVSIPLLAVDTGTLRVGGHLERIVATSLGRLDVLLSPTSVASWQLLVLFSACFFRTVFALFVSALVRQRYIMMSCEGDV